MAGKESQVGVTVSENLILPILEAKVQAAIIEALGDERSLIERVVTAALTKKIKPDQYSHKEVPWIEHVCQNVIQAAARDAIEQWAGSQKEAITQEFLRQLKTRKTSSSVVGAMIEGLNAAASHKWKFSVELPH